MKNPRLIIDRNKLRQNISFLCDKMKAHHLDVMAVTKVFSAHPKIIEIFEEFPEITYFGDSRIENLASYKTSSKTKVLIRIPMQSEAREVITYADISLNSEITTIRLLNKEAQEQNKLHKLVLMIDLGDLREGIFEEEELMTTISEIMEMSSVQLFGIGVNLTCYGAIIPDEDILTKLVDYQAKIEQKYSISLQMVSGGNSSSLYLLDDPKQHLPSGITNLRIGEAFVLGRETAFAEDYLEMSQDVFTLVTEIVELKMKPSLPIGRIGVDAFGESPKFVDKGMMKRGILGIGRQDVSPTAITLIDDTLEIIGASSDHLIMDFTHEQTKYKVGMEVAFKLDYGSLLSSFTSPYVKKEFIN